jgi:hypothetical protein
MIFSYQVKWIAEKFLRETLNDYPGVLNYLLEHEKFGKWTRLCAERLTQLDMAGYVKSGSAVDEFIKVAAARYAEKQLEKLGHLPTTSNPGNDEPPKLA